MRGDLESAEVGGDGGVRRGVGGGGSDVLLVLVVGVEVVLRRLRVLPEVVRGFGLLRVGAFGREGVGDVVKGREFGREYGVLCLEFDVGGGSLCSSIFRT